MGVIGNNFLLPCTGSILFIASIDTIRADHNCVHDVRSLLNINMREHVEIDPIPWSQVAQLPDHLVSINRLRKTRGVTKIG